MLSRKLQYDSALEKIGDIVETATFVFRRNDPLVTMAKELRAEEEQLARDGKGRDSLSNEYYEKNRMLSRHWKESGFMEFLRKVTPKHSGDIVNIDRNLFEILLNAWDHGMDEEDSIVTMEICVGENRKLFISVEQSGEGFDYEKTYRKACRKKERERDRARGGGMARIRCELSTLFGYERTVQDEQQRFRSLLFRTLSE